jgi:hypothetical protein
MLCSTQHTQGRRASSWAENSRPAHRARQQGLQHTLHKEHLSVSQSHSLAALTRVSTRQSMPGKREEKPRASVAKASQEPQLKMP